jgi:hypothetical protein
MDFEKASERRKKGQLEKIEEAGKNEISRRFGDTDQDLETERQQSEVNSSSLRSDSNSNSLRPDVQKSDDNPQSEEGKRAA